MSDHGFGCTCAADTLAFFQSCIETFMFRSPLEKKVMMRHKRSLTTTAHYRIKYLRSSGGNVLYLLLSILPFRLPGLFIDIIFTRPYIISEVVSQFTIVKFSQNTHKIVIIHWLHFNRGRNLGRGWDGSAKICLRLSCATKKLYSFFTLPRS